MPLDVTSDKDFMAAHPDEQAAYLKSIDPDFAKAPPTEQRMYLSHVNRVTPAISAPNMGGMIQEDETTARTAGLPGGSSIPHQASDRELAVRAIPAGVAALGMAPTVAGVAATAMRAHPLMTTLGLTAAQQAPGTIGRIASKIPSWLPMLAGEGRLGGAAEAEAEGAGLSKTRLGPDAPPQEITQSRGLGRPPETDPAAGLGKIPVAAPEPQAGPINFPPDEPTPNVTIPGPSAPSSRRDDLLEDQGIQQGMRDYLDKQGKQVHAFEPIGRSKGAINQDFNAAMGKPSPPVKYTPTPGVRSSSPSPKLGEGTPPTEDLTPILQKSLAAARKKKDGR